MKKVLNTALILNFLTDGPVGVFLVFSPQTFLPAGQVEGILWVRNYGVAALAVASMIFWVWSSRDDYGAMGVALGFLLAFHSALTVALLVTGGQLVGTILHFILATLFVLLYFQREKWCTLDAMRR
jgi:hypothetical protein